MLNYFAVLLLEGVESTRSANNIISLSYQASGRPIRKPDFFVRIWNLEFYVTNISLECMQIHVIITRNIDPL